MRKNMMKKELDGLKARVRKCELFDIQVAKLLELSQEGAYVDPFTYAKDELDKQIITILLTHKVVTAPEIAKLVNEPNRIKITKRLQRFESESMNIGEQWLRFDPKNRFGHYRAWWLITERINPKLLALPEKDNTAATDEEKQTE